MAQMGDQPCWSCTKACGGCAWTEVDQQAGKIRFEPIPGWDAEKVFYRNGYGTTGETFKINACPEYEREPERTTSAEGIKQMLIERAAELYKEGLLPTEISEVLNVRTRRALAFLEEAKEMGLL